MCKKDSRFILEYFNSNLRNTIQPKVFFFFFGGVVMMMIVEYALLSNVFVNVF